MFKKMWTMVVDVDNPNWIKDETLFKRILIKIGVIEVIERKFESPPKRVYKQTKLINLTN